MPHTVITGANSGIALAWSKILLQEGHEVIACDVTHGNGLEELVHLGATIMTLDVTDPNSIALLTKALEDTPLDNLLNVAGIMVGQGNDALATCNHSTLQKTFAVNTFGPFLLTQALLPNLLASRSPKIVMVSSRVGSVGDNSSGGSYAYRSSKAALNSISKSLAVDLKDKNIPVIILHPGLAKTPLAPKNAEVKEALEPDEAAQKLWKLFKSKGMEETGKFWHRDDYELPW